MTLTAANFSRLTRTLLASGLLLISMGAPAQSAAPSKPATPPVPLLWKVSDADNAVYLIGSFHLLRPSDYPLSKDAEAALADAKSVLFEMPPEEMESPDMPKQMLQAALRRDGGSLEQELGADTWARLQTWAQGNGMSAQNLAMFEPWFVGLTISLVEMNKQGLDPKLGLDRHFMQEAQAGGKTTGGLERAADQIQLLDGMDAQEQRQLVKQSLEEAEKGSAYTERLHRAWREGDISVMWNEMAVDLKKDFPRLYQRINVDRNDRWVPQIEQRLRTGGRDNTLVVVGALHLLGSDGVVEKLRAKGYKVERICSACKMK